MRTVASRTQPNPAVHRTGDRGRSANKRTGGSCVIMQAGGEGRLGGACPTQSSSPSQLSATFGC